LSLLSLGRITRKTRHLLLISALFLVPNLTAFGQQSVAGATMVDGNLVWDSGSQQGQQVALFGVNYAVPFAYSYRALEKRGIDHKAAIDMDVAHIARLGLDAYRVHVWDRQISDQQGNLLLNHHLDLFDYLLAKLAQHDIRVVITPIAWWGSGYPEPDPQEPGFSALYTKAEMNHKVAAINAQHNYLKQFFNHINPYTNLSYARDPNIIAIELFNEPRHEDSLKNNEAYIEGLAQIARDAGVNKPLFYNISEQGNNPEFAQRLCSTSIDGLAYQWYPAGLVKNSELAANLLPTVDHYTNPFAGTAACQNKGLMIYEFDSADTANSVMYPAMARSFKEAGFQWATQFAYDPAAIADTNSDYNTHYLNLLYTPEKAISIMIAAQVFRQTPRLQKQANYPASNIFSSGHSHITLDYQQNLSVLNSVEQFLYSNSTNTQPLNINQLKHIAGVGSSPIVSYQGTGAYFLDKLSEGNWRLEVYPDVLPLQDPYQASSLKREVGRLYSGPRQFSFTLSELGKSYYVKGLNTGNDYQTQSQDGQITVEPGVYLLSKGQGKTDFMSTIDNHFLLPTLKKPQLAIWHQNQREMNLSDQPQFSLQVGSQHTPDKVELLIRYRGHKTFTALLMQPNYGNKYKVNLPVNTPQWSKAGQLEYGFVVTTKNSVKTFPGNDEGSPTEWDFVPSQVYWQTELRPTGAPVTVFDAKDDHDILIYPNSAASSWEYVIGQQGQDLALRLSKQNLSAVDTPLVRMTLAKNNAFLGRNLAPYNAVAIKIRSVEQNEHLQFSMLNSDGLAQGIELEVSPQWQYLVVPLASLKPVDTLLPQSYPMFMPAFYRVNPADKQSRLTENLSGLQGIQLALLGQNYAKKALKGWHEVELAEVKLLIR
jgi:hypothetical protein